MAKRERYWRRLKKNDGFLRSGNVVVPQDAEGNAAALEIYTFLMLKMQDGKTLLTHLCEESETAKKILGSENYRKLRAGFYGYSPERAYRQQIQR